MIKKAVTPLLLVVVLVLTANLSAQDKPLKVYLLVGQSNMQGHAHVKTLAHMGMDESMKAVLEEIQDSSGTPKVVDDVWISYLSAGVEKSGPLTTGFGAADDKIGPELTFGIYMQKRLGEPILIIKTAWGGKSINTDFRPPSAGPYVFHDAVLERLEKRGQDIDKIKADKVKATGAYYRDTVAHVKKVLSNIEEVVPGYKESQGYELAGLVWFQGWNDMVDSGTYPRRGEPGGYNAYSEVLTHMIRDFRKDLDAPELPFVIGVMGVNGPTEQYTKQQQRYKKIHQGFRDAMAAPAMQEEFKSNVVNVLTEHYWDMELDRLVSRESTIRGTARRLAKSGDSEKIIEAFAGGEEPSPAAKEELETLMKSRKFERVLAEKMLSKEFSEREMLILKNGKSNAAFHYFGCAKIMAGIGKGFADAMPIDQ